MAQELETLAAESREGHPPSSPSLGENQTLLAASTNSGDAGATPGPGSVVGRYVILEEVGRGAMGIICSAYDPKLDRKVAVKLLIDRDRDRQSLREAQALARLNHPNVVKVYDAGEHDGRVFMAMEFVIGKPLGAWRSDAAPSLPAILQVFQRAALGLAAAHEAGLVHRDFKPDNVMIAEDGRVLVMDFGLAVVRHGDAKAKVGAAKFWASGTPAYMSPEQFSNDPLGPKSDQFSFFVALYEALASERPFVGESLATLALAVTSGQISQAAPLRGVPAWLRRLVLRGLCVAADDRHESMDAVAKQLEAGLGRRRRVVGLGLAGVAIVAAFGAWSFGRESEQEDPAAAHCRADAQALSASWTPEWKRGTQEIFVHALEPDGEQMWRRVEAKLDGFGATWAAAYDDACSARFVSLTLDAAAFDRRIRCLDGQREYTTSLLESLDTVDSESLRDIAAVTADLPRASSCETDLRAQADFDRPSQELVAEARRQLMRAHGRADAGDNAAARSIVVATLTSVEELDAPATRAELLRILGGVDASAGDLDGADASLAHAVRESARSGEARLLAESWLARVNFLAGVAKEYARAEALLEAVEVAAAAVPDDPELRSELDSLRGLIAIQQGHTSEARDAFQAALELAEQRELGPKSISLHAKRLGAAEARLGELGEAREHFTRAAELSAELYGERHSAVVGAYGNLGLLCRQEGDRDCEREQLEKAVALAEPNHPLRARYLVLLGQLEYDQGHTDEAQRLAQEAVEIFEAAYGPLHPDLTPPRLLLSNVLNRRGDLEGAYAQAQKLVEIAEQTTPANHPKRAIASSNLGEALRARGDLDEALAAHMSALNIREIALDPGDARIGYSLAQTAGILRALDRHGEARDLAQRAMTILDAASGNESWSAGARFTLALSTDDRREARRLATEALTIYESLSPGFQDRANDVREWLSGANP